MALNSEKGKGHLIQRMLSTSTSMKDNTACQNVSVVKDELGEKQTFFKAHLQKSLQYVQPKEEYHMLHKES